MSRAHDQWIISLGQRNVAGSNWSMQSGNALIMRWNNLGGVAEKDFVAVVGWGIVTGGHHHASGRTKMMMFQAKTGVGSGDGNSRARTPMAANTLAVSIAKSWLLCRAS